MMQCAMIFWNWKATSILMRYAKFVFSVDVAYIMRQLNGQINVHKIFWGLRFRGLCVRKWTFFWSHCLRIFLLTVVEKSRKHLIILMFLFTNLQIMNGSRSERKEVLLEEHDPIWVELRDLFIADVRNFRLSDLRVGCDF
jgi:hypothetical protein